MVKTIKTLVSDVYGLLEDGKLSDTSLIDKYSEQMGEVLHTRFNKEERSPTLRMSNVGRPLRQLWYELRGYKGETLTGKTLLKFSYGDATEALLIFLAKASGHTVERSQEEIEIDGIKGHIDCVLDRVLVDIKSCSSYSFKKFEDGSLLEEGNDPFGYVAQLSGYAHALGLPAAWVAFDKTSGDMCVLELPQDKIDEYDIQKRIAQVKEVIKQDNPPERCYSTEPDGKSGNEALSVGCSYCSFKFECYKDANEGKGLRVFAYASKPRFLTKVVREPKTFEIKKEEAANEAA